MMNLIFSQDRTVHTLTAKLFKRFIKEVKWRNKSMISDIKQAIVNKLIELYPGYMLYDEVIPQDFSRHSFLISVTAQSCSKRFDNKYKSSISFDIAYFSDKEEREIKQDCLNVQMSLLRNFDLIGKYRALNKKTAITENVLHFTFDINYCEIKANVSDKMQKQQTNTNI